MIIMPSLGLARPLNDTIVAIVDNDVITLKDLKDYVSSVYRQLKVEHRTPEEIQQIMVTYEEKGVNQLIEDKLILAAADQKGVEIRPEVISKRLKEIKDRYPSEDDFLNEISSQGITVTDLKNKIISQFKAKYVVDMEVRNKIFINPEQVTSYYNDHKNEFSTKTKYNLDSIYINFDKGREAAIQRLKEARGKLAAGENFDKVSKEYSQASSIGVLEQGQMVPTIEKEVFSLKEGELSQIVEVGGGVYLFKVNGISQGVQESLEDAKDSVYNKLFDMQFQEKFKAWIDKLRNKAYVEVRS
jgi:parvulin-like peptidyl-prolyl isomerase